MNAAALLSIGLLLQALAPAHAPKITEEMIKSYLATQYDCKAEDIYIDKMEYFNFTGHEYSDVMVVASTCATGTAGPDVHSVFSWADEDQLGELEIEEVNPKLYQVLFGNRPDEVVPPLLEWPAPPSNFSAEIQQSRLYFVFVLAVLTPPEWVRRESES